MWRKALLLLLWPLTAAAETPSREDILNLARAGWTYELRTTMRRPGSAALVRNLNARAMAGAEVCLLGEPANDRSLQTIAAFTHLWQIAFNTAPRFIHAEKITDCTPSATVFLRLFSNSNPTAALNADLKALDQTFGLSLSQRPQFPSSPAQAQTFFGTEGMATHIMVTQAGPWALPDWHHSYYRSLLVEELFQSFTFGMDILHLNSEQPFFSKLQEAPLYTQHLPWRSDDFIRSMLHSSPRGLCGADLVMLAALGETELERTNTAAFTSFVSDNLDRFLTAARLWQSDPQVQLLLDPACQALPN